MDDTRTRTLLAWQWDHYPDGHADRLNLVLHALTAPLFWAGTLALVAAPLRGGLLGAGTVARRPRRSPSAARSTSSRASPQSSGSPSPDFLSAENSPPPGVAPARMRKLSRSNTQRIRMNPR
jgi:hypothetical protein